MREWIVIGCVGKPWGIRGAFFLFTHLPTTHLSALRIGSPLSNWQELARKKNSAYTHYVNTAKQHSVVSVIKAPLKANKTSVTRYRVRLAGLASQNQVESVKGWSVLALRHELTTQEKKSSLADFFWSDFYHCQVTLPDSTYLGQVISIDNYGASDVIAIENHELRWHIPFVDTYFKVSQLQEPSRSELIYLGDPDSLPDFCMKESKS